MTDRDALLRAVAANPDEDTPRLIYADLLDELGGEPNVARARFIRLQIEMTRNPARSWFALSDRLAEVCRLAGQFADKWLDELPRWAAKEGRGQRLRAEDFPRGFLDTFHVRPARFVSQGAELLDVAPVTRIVALGPLNYESLRTFLSCPFLTRIRSLTFEANDRDLAASFVKTSWVLETIEKLNLSGVGFSDSGAATLAQAYDLRNLHTLVVRNSGLSETGAAKLLSSPNLPKLLQLDIQGTQEGYRWVAALRRRFPRQTILV